MTEKYRKLKIILNKKRPVYSRVVDEQTGEMWLSVADIQILVTKNRLFAQIMIENPDIEVEGEDAIRQLLN